MENPNADGHTDNQDQTRGPTVGRQRQELYPKSRRALTVVPTARAWFWLLAAVILSIVVGVLVLPMIVTV